MGAWVPELAHGSVIKTDRQGRAPGRRRRPLADQSSVGQPFGQPGWLPSTGCPMQRCIRRVGEMRVESLLAPTVQDHLSTANGRGVRAGQWSAADAVGGHGVEATRCGGPTLPRHHAGPGVADSRPPAVAGVPSDYFRQVIVPPRPPLSLSGLPKTDARRGRGVPSGHSPRIIPRPRHDHRHCQRQPKVDPGWRHLCHTPASMAPASGVHFKVTQERLGHSSMSGGARRDSNPIRFLIRSELWPIPGCNK